MASSSRVWRRCGSPAAFGTDTHHLDPYFSTCDSSSKRCLGGMSEPMCVLSRVIPNGLRLHITWPYLGCNHPWDGWKPQRLQRSYAATRKHVGVVEHPPISTPALVAPLTLLQSLGMVDTRLATWHIGWKLAETRFPRSHALGQARSDMGAIREGCGVGVRSDRHMRNHGPPT
jgi:hypothetical protein